MIPTWRGADDRTIGGSGFVMPRLGPQETEAEFKARFDAMVERLTKGLTPMAENKTPREAIGETRAVLYARNPLSITEAELITIQDLSVFADPWAEVKELRGGSYAVVSAMGRGDSVTRGKFETFEDAEYYRLALQWFARFFPMAVRELRAITQNAVDSVADVVAQDEAPSPPAA